MEITVHFFNGRRTFVKTISDAKKKELEEIFGSKIRRIDKPGRTKAGLAKDRKYTSQEPHEQSYKKKRKSTVQGYKSKKIGLDSFRVAFGSGGQTDTPKIYGTRILEANLGCWFNSEGFVIYYPAKSTMQGLFWDKTIKGWVDDPDYATIYQTLFAATATIPEAKKALKGVQNPEKMWAGAVIRGAVTAHSVYSSLTPEQKPIARKLVGQLLRSGGRPWKQRKILKSPEAKALFTSLTPEQKQQIVAAGMSKGKKKFETGGTTGKVTLTPEAIILEDGYVYHKLSNGDYTDGDNLYKADVFDYDKMGADIDGDGDLWEFSKYDKTHPNYDNERYLEGQNFIKELITTNDLPGQFATGGSISKLEVRDTLSKKKTSSPKARLNKYGFPLEDFESEYKGEIIMHWPDRKPLQWFSNDQTFDSLKEVKEYIDKGSPMDERTINAYRHGAFDKGGKTDPCWDNYEMVGMKKKNGKEVPNCVPKFDAGGQITEIDENGSNVPEDLQEIFNQYNENEDPYHEAERLKVLANEIGYDFDYDLSGEPTDFWKTNYETGGAVDPRYYSALGDIVRSVETHPLLEKYRTKNGTKLGEIKDLGEQGVIALAEKVRADKENYKEWPKSNYETGGKLPNYLDLPKAKSTKSISKKSRMKISSLINELAQMGVEARKKGTKAPNYNLCDISLPGTNIYCAGNKNIPREQMPQFKGFPLANTFADKLPKDKDGEVDTEAFFNKLLKDKNVKVSSSTNISPDKLRATQKELIGTKVAGMSKVLYDKKHPAYKIITDPIYISNDGYVLDGHHRWASIVAYNIQNPNNPITLKVKVIDMPIKPLVKLSNKFAKDIGIKSNAFKKGGPIEESEYPIVDSGSISKKEIDDVKKRLYQSPPGAIKEDPEDMEIDYAGFEMMNRGGLIDKNGNKFDSKHKIVKDVVKKLKPIAFSSIGSGGGFEHDFFLLPDGSVLSFHYAQGGVYISSNKYTKDDFLQDDDEYGYNNKIEVDFIEEENPQLTERSLVDTYDEFGYEGGNGDFDSWKISSDELLKRIKGTKSYAKGGTLNKLVVRDTLKKSTR